MIKDINYNTKGITFKIEPKIWLMFKKVLLHQNTTLERWARENIIAFVDCYGVEECCTDEEIEYFEKTLKELDDEFTKRFQEKKKEKISD